MAMINATAPSQHVQLNRLFPECLLLLAKFLRIPVIHSKYNDSNESEIADMLTSFFEGGIIVSRALSNPEILVTRLMQFRKHIQLLYTTHF